MDHEKSVTAHSEPSALLQADQMGGAGYTDWPAALAPWLLMAVVVAVVFPSGGWALGPALILAAGFYPALGLSPEKRALALIAVCVLLAPLPLLVPPANTLSRLLAGIFVATIGLKLYDVHVGVGLDARPPLGRFIGFLPNMYNLVLRKAHLEPHPPVRRSLVSLLSELFKLAVAFTIFRLLFEVEWRGQPFLLEHAAKVAALFVAVLPMIQVPVHLLRLAGVPARDFAERPFLAHTPAEFWRRYNRVIQQILFEDVFRRVGGPRSFARATLLTFIVSGLLHEYMVSLAVSGVKGYMLAFFLLQGLAVAATARLRPRGWAVLPAALGTWIFLILSTIPVIAILNRVTTFYATGPPGWLW